ncbi:MAG: DUF4147 domain-containing protein [Pirellulales bacterium]
MPRCEAQLRRDALHIWRAGVAAVDSARLVRQAVEVRDSRLWLSAPGGDPIDFIDLASVGRIAVVGGGKAGAGMAQGLLDALGAELLASRQVRGWINVPADCVRPAGPIHLHSARPAGRNEPTEQGVAGTDAILRLAASLTPDDLCFALISGGASALLPAPVEGISLADKLAITRHLSESGANIAELNTVRKQLSRIKGGGLARACRAGRLVALVISDVLGDPLDVIASGPTVPDTSTREQALEVLDRHRARGISPTIVEHLARTVSLQRDGTGCRVTNLVIGNNATAVEGAAAEARRLGYTPSLDHATELEGPAEAVGRRHAELALRMRAHDGPDCLVTGGEPVVRLPAADIRGLGGRNQQLALAALEQLMPTACRGIALVSGGTDGEDGPTDAAGAVVDQTVVEAAVRLGLDPADHLARCDAYHFFAPLDALIRTGPTHTNVCDVRVVVAARHLAD